MLGGILRFGCVCALSGLAGGFAALADPQSGDVGESAGNATGEIVVTAQHRTENLQNVPIAITAIGGDKISESGVARPQDLFRQTPSIHYQAPGGPESFPIYTVRGVSLLNYSYTSESPVATYNDGVYLGNSALVNQNLFDLERVEVLRGPQGTLYGRNAIGGLINFISRQPTKEFSANAYSEIGNFGDLTLGGAISGPLGDHVRARLAANYNSMNGWQTNLVDGRKWGKVNHALGLRGIVDIDLSSALTVKFSGHYSDASGSNDLETLKGKREPGDLSQTCSVADIEASRCVNGSGFGVTSHSPYVGYSKHPPAPFALRAWGINAQLVWDLGPVTLTSITAYEHVRRTNANDIPAAAIAPVDEYIQYGILGHQFSEELRFNGDIGKLKWQAGAFYYKDRRFYTPALPYLDIGNYADQSIRSIAGFADGTYSITPDLHVTAGVRYTSDRISLDDFAFVLDPMMLTRQGTAVFTLNDHISPSKVTWRAGTDWHFAPGQMVYATVSTGFASGQYNTTIVSSPTAIGPVNPETLTTYEIGLKSSLLDRRLTLDIAGYYTRWKHVQAQAAIQTPSGVTRDDLLNVGNANIEGAEVELTYRPVPTVTAQMGFAYNHNKLHAPGITIGGVPLDGNKLPNVPRTNLNGSLEWTPPLGGGNSLDLALDANYQSKVYYRPDNLPWAVQKSYSLVDGRVGWVSSSERLRVDIFSKNLFNKKYFINATDDGDAALYFWGMPRTYGLRLSVKY